MPGGHEHRKGNDHKRILLEAEGAQLCRNNEQRTSNSVGENALIPKISSDITHLSPLANADASVVVDISKFETTADLGAGAKPEATPAAMIKENTVANFIVPVLKSLR